MRYRPVTSCLLPLGEVQGKHLVSIEGSNGNGLNSVQRALVDQGAVQCGYCTPGLVIALTVFLLSPQTFSLPQVLEAVGGSLRRCTGYVAIKRAVAELCQRFPVECIDETGRGLTLVQWGILPDRFRSIPERLRQLPTPKTTAHLRDATVVAGEPACSCRSQIVW